jgi:hypothetical protein
VGKCRTSQASGSLPVKLLQKQFTIVTFELRKTTGGKQYLCTLKNDQIEKKIEICKSFVFQQNFAEKNVWEKF